MEGEGDGGDKPPTATKHKFLLGNPCGPCEWHIERDIRVFAWFDCIFQGVFVIPVILQLTLNLNTLKGEGGTNATNGDGCAPGLASAKSAVLYSVFDTINLSTGLISDLILYIGSRHRRLQCTMICIYQFLFMALIREILHIAAASIHFGRCPPGSYAYEIVVRLLCQYMIYGVWIGVEYLGWLRKGRLFVPRRSQMEPPVLQVTFMSNHNLDPSVLTSVTDLGTGPIIRVASAPEEEEPAPTKKRKSKRKIKEEEDAPKNIPSSGHSLHK